MKEIQRVGYHGFEIVVMSRKFRQTGSQDVVTRFCAEIRNRGDVVLYRTDPVADNPEVAIEDAKEFFDRRE